MSELMRKRLHLYFGIVTGLLVVATGVLFIVSCVNIYRSGDSPFTYASIGLHFKRIAWVAFATIAVAVIAGLFRLILPVEEKKLRVTHNDAPVLARLREKKGRNVASVKEEKLRFWLRTGGALICVIALVLPLPRLLDVDRYTMEALEGNAVIIDSVLLLLLPVAVLIAVSIAVSYLCKFSLKREIVALKTEESVAAKAPASVAKIAALRRFFEKNEKKLLLTARVILPVLAVALIIFGALNGGMADVLQKAIRICTECIGLG